MSASSLPAGDAVTVKFVIVGECGVGKTSLLFRYMDNKFDEAHIFSTVGQGDFRQKSVDVDGREVRVQIWDTAGAERFRTITQSYWRDAKVGVICFDLSDAESLHTVEQWNADLLKYGPRPPPVVVLCGCKLDLDSAREVSTAMGEQVAQKIQAVYIETSSKSGANVDKLFVQSSQAYLKRKLAESEAAAAPETFDTVKIILTDKPAAAKHKQKGKCLV